MSTLERCARSLALLCLLVMSTAAAAPRDLPPGDLPTVPVDPSDEPPALPTLDWIVTSNVQIDGLLHSNLEDRDREDSIEARRARLSALVEYDFDWLIRAGVDLADRGDIRELSIEYRGLPVYFELGRIAEPFGMLQGGARYLALMERPQAYALATGFGLGVNASARGQRWGAAGGVFKASRNSALDEGGREEDALTLRGTYVPVFAEDALLHVGAAVSVRKAEEASVQFVGIPETILLTGINVSSPLLFTGFYGSNRYHLFGAEVASMLGPVLLRAEYMLARLEDVLALDERTFEAAAGSPTYRSGYAEAAWAITGERRDYSVRRGAFGGIDPERPLDGGGFGAFEVAVRYSYTDLMDADLGGEEGTVLSGGINWYVIDDVRVMLDALRIEETSAQGTEDAFAVQARLQATFSVP